MTTDDDLRGAAFRRLLRTGAPASAVDLAGDLAQPEDRVRAAVDALHARGQIRLDDDRRIIGSAGLSIRPDRHQVDIEGRRLWTWCAYDIFGIFAALGASGHAQSPSPDGGAPIELTFRGGRPEPVTPCARAQPRAAFALRNRLLLGHHCS